MYSDEEKFHFEHNYVRVVHKTIQNYISFPTLSYPYIPLPHP